MSAENSCNVPTTVHLAAVRPETGQQETYNGSGCRHALRLSIMATLPSSHALLQRAAILLLCTAPFAAVAVARTHAGQTPFDRAERLREALEAQPQRRRTHGDYERVLAAYRDIYRTHPANPQADAAVNAEADLLAEEGRVFADRRLFAEAVDQYAMLRRQYPASPFRQNALLNQAEIEQSELHNDQQAEVYFSDFLRLYPHSPLATEARQQLKAARHSAPPEHEDEAKTDAYQQPLAATGTAPADARAAQAAENARQHARELAELNALGNTSGSSRRRSTQKSAQAPVQAAPVQAQPSLQQQTQQQAPASLESTAAEAPAGNHKPVFVTGIRHWSTPVYTRVAIDLSDQVQYEAARVPDPDRIFFDLHGARLAPGLAGKPVDVIDDGYLRRVRAAQYGKDSTRVVLDVSHVSEYSAFLLPNPWRLIIDIHGAAVNGATLYAENAAATTPERVAPSQNQPSVPAPPAVTNRRSQTASSSAQEVASLGQAPTKVKATHHPTTAPIAASVSGTTRAAQPNELEDLATNGPGPANVPPAPGTPAIAPSPPANDPAANGTAPTATPKHRRRTASGTDAPGVATTTPTNLAPEIPAAGGHEAIPTSTGQRSLVRALGLKIGRIVIDAGHGGHDSGTLGPEGIEEKDVVLDVALRLGKLLKQRLGADVIYTRSDDTFIPLETRTAIANKAQADLFISVHANSSPDPSARGVEVYYLNFTTSPEALEVAARENAVSDQSIYQLSDLVKKITLKDKIDESHEFAADVENSLYSGLEIGNPGLKDRGVKKAPFVVLIGANMPSILAEISFLTNPEDARELRDPAYRQRIAESLYQGVARYISGLSGVRIAQNGSHAAAQ